MGSYALIFHIFLLIPLRLPFSSGTWMYRFTDTIFCQAIFLLAFLCSAASPVAATDFFYFNPDSTQSNLSRLKGEMDKVLSEHSTTITFQPFARLIDFDRKVKEDQPAFLFLPTWYLEQNDNQQKFEPLLVPYRNGVSTYKKVLLVPHDSLTTMENLTGKTMAMTSMGPNSLTFLNKTLFSQHGIDSKLLSIVTTTKDSDALFALALRQVDATFVSMDNMAQIGKINPRILQTVRPLCESPPIPLPILCYTKGKVTPSEIAAMKKIFLENSEGKNFIHLMEMLQIDAWEIYSN